MGREIKFKLWHKPTKEMYYYEPSWGNYEQGGGWIGGVLLEDYKRDGRTFHPSNQMQLSPESCEWLQYTGLKDSKGREIYEGDIVHIDSSPQEDNKIEYYEGIYMLLPHGLYLSDWYKFVEVIGNIYENSELLKQEA